MVNYFWLTLKVACMFRPCRTCDPMVGVSKYEFNQKLLGGVTFYRIMSDVY